MTSLADKSLLSGGDNKPPMLEKHLYDSWKSRMELYMMNRPHGRMILASVEKGPLVWPSITEDGVTRLKEYVELTPAEAIQADCDIKAINIILQGLPTEIYALAGICSTTYHQATTRGFQPDSSLVVPSFFRMGMIPIDAINTMMSFLTAVVQISGIHTSNALELNNKDTHQEEKSILADPDSLDVKNLNSHHSQMLLIKLEDLDAYDSFVEELNFHQKCSLPISQERIRCTPLSTQSRKSEL
ncbi:hypothetical protein Tco_0822088 [Tanacetum coccineum]|uniref:Uncharacterized protein n=1 Tax=Tanacetum coccineum TaxID=301880 RepID=A0ABQ5AFV2_9ASTR